MISRTDSFMSEDTLGSQLKQDVLITCRDEFADHHSRSSVGITWPGSYQGMNQFMNCMGRPMFWFNPAMSLRMEEVDRVMFCIERSMV